jgi:AcrR family transcriptional regulator
VFASFGSKEELQLATVRAALGIFRRAVVVPVEGGEDGLPKVWALCRSWLAYSRDRIFPGGCFFFAVSAEFDAQPGPVRDLLAGADRAWSEYLTDQLRAALAAGQLRAGTDLDEVAFALVSCLDTANAQAVLHDDPARYDLAARAIARLLGAAATDPALLS